jgi:hypothetical protein
VHNIGQDATEWAFEVPDADEDNVEEVLTLTQLCNRRVRQARDAMSLHLEQSNLCEVFCQCRQKTTQYF